MKTILIDSQRQKTYCKSLIDEMPEDGSMTVIVKKTDMGSTGAQRRLYWQWATEISLSGLGADDTKESVHIRAKYQFGHPILLRDSETYGAIFAGFEIVIKDYDPETKRECYREFSRDFIHTEQLTKAQRAEMMTDMQNFWTRRGVDLTNPDDLGLDKTFNLKRKPKKGEIT